MNIFKAQFLDKSLGMPEVCNESSDNYMEIREILRQVQSGYTERNIEKVDAFVKKLFVSGEAPCVLGTGTGELFLGSEEVKNLIKNDWEYWGDVNIDCENAHISVEGEVAWFATKGSVKYTFEHTPERYDSYVDFIKSNAEDTELTAKQKITFINWVLALTYHQREDKKREYLWPLCISGVLLKEQDKWKIIGMQFSIPKSSFPDERFENSKEYLDNYNNQNPMADKYKSNQITQEIKELLKILETEFVGQKDISKELVSKYFAEDSLSYVIGPENCWYYGIDKVREFFSKSSNSKLLLDLEHAIALKSHEVTWVSVTGVLKQSLTEEELAEHALKELDNLFKSDLTSKEKLFTAHRSIAYVLKESATGENYTCPIRLTAVILNHGGRAVFHQIHFSFPSYWILEGKIDGILEK